MDPYDQRLAAAARRVHAWQQGVHGDRVDGVCAGRFTLLGRTVDFGTLDAVDWRRDLGEGNNALWRMTLSYFGYAPVLLARGDEQALRSVAALVESLERRNPFRARGVFRDVWNPYGVSHRLINLLLGLHLAGPPAKGDDAARRTLLRHVALCAAFVAANLERDLGYNHLLKNCLALALYSCGAGEVPAAWRSLNRMLPTCVESQVLADGGHAERAPMYHALAMLDLLVLADAAAGVLQADAMRRINDALARMRGALAVTTHPDGDIALFNDSWLGEAPPGSALAEGAAADGCTALPDAGYVQLRDGANAAIFDCGACGPDDNPAHAQADFLAMELSVHGRRLLVDFGVPTYSAGPLRDRSRSAASHNGPRFEGVEPLECWHSFRVGRRGAAHRIASLNGASDALPWCAGWQDGYATIGAVVARCLVLHPRRGLLVVDVWRGGEEAPAAVDFLVGEGWRAEASLRFVAADGAAVRFGVVAGACADVAPARHWPRFGQPLPATKLRLRPARDAAGRWCATWIGWGGEAPAQAAASAWREGLLGAIGAANSA